MGISPAASKIEHVLKYHLPTEAYDVILYTGLHYIGRDTLLVTSSDAVISIGGRLGTLHEFTVAMESETPIGFLQGAGGVSEEIHTIMKLARPLPRHAEAVFSSDPTQLIAQLEAILDAERHRYYSKHNTRYVRRG